MCYSINPPNLNNTLILLKIRSVNSIARNLKRHILEGSRIYLSDGGASKKRSLLRVAHRRKSHGRRSETTRADNARRGLRREQRGSRSIRAPSDPIPRVPIHAGKCSTETIPRNSQTSTPTCATIHAGRIPTPRSRFNHKWRHEAREGDDARKRRERESFCAEEGKGLDALAFHNTVAVYWSDVRAQRSRTKRERKGGGGGNGERVGKEGRNWNERMK